jgi:hypothetical protein
MSLDLNGDITINGTTYTNGIDNNGQTIENVANPVNSQAVATKSYVVSKKLYECGYFGND